MPVVPVMACSVTRTALIEVASTVTAGTRVRHPAARLRPNAASETFAAGLTRPAAEERAGIAEI